MSRRFQCATRSRAGLLSPNLSWVGARLLQSGAPNPHISTRLVALQLLHSPGPRANLHGTMVFLFRLFLMVAACTHVFLLPPVTLLDFRLHEMTVGGNVFVPTQFYFQICVKTVPQRRVCVG